MAVFKDEYKKRFGESYAEVAQDGSMLKKLADEHGHDVVIARIPAYLAWDDNFVATAGHPAWGLRKWWLRLAASLRQQSSGGANVRAKQFCTRYAALYSQHRRGAKYLPQANDLAKAVELCSVWDDARLDRLAAVFLKTDHEFAASGSRTLGQFSVLASWCDDRLREVEGR